MNVTNMVLAALGAVAIAACGGGSSGQAEATPRSGVSTLAAHPKEGAIVVYASQGKSVATYRLDPATGVLSFQSSIDVAQPV